MYGLCKSFRSAVEVVVDSVDTTSLQPSRLRFIQQPQAGADVQVVFLFDLRNDFLDRFHLAFVWSASGDYQAVGLRTSFGRDFGGVHQRISFENVVLGNGSVGDLGLAAVVTILGAQTALGVHQKVQLDGVAKVLMTNSVTGRDDCGHVQVGRFQHRQSLLTGDRRAVEDLLSQCVVVSRRRKHTDGR